MSPNKLCTIRSLIAALAVYALPAANPQRYIPVCRLDLGFERAGSSLVLVRMAERMPAYYRIEIHSAHGVRFLNDLNQLKGLVTIGTAPDALKYVRLLSSYATGHAIHDGSYGEILSETEYATVPTFGLPNESFAHWGGGATVLTNYWFRKGGMSPATVWPTPTGFVVERWLAGGGGMGSYAYKVKETVSSDGAYRIVVLVKHHRLPAAIQWKYVGID